MSNGEVAPELAPDEAVCAEHWKQITDKPSQIEMVLGTIALLLLVSEGSVVRGSLPDNGKRRFEALRTCAC